MLFSLTEQLWYAQDGLYMPGGFMHFSLRMTIIRLSDGSLVLHSPIRIDDNLAAQIAELGEVKHLIGPNCLHHLHLKSALDRYPQARVYGAPGLNRKRKDLTFDEILTETAPQAWSGEIDQVHIKGAPAANEIVFFHRPSRSLIVTDLVFNIHEYKGWLTGLVLRLVGAHKRLGQSRLWRLLSKDRQALRNSVQRVLELDFTRIIMAHGDIFDKNPKENLKKALSRMLKP